MDIDDEDARREIAGLLPEAPDPPPVNVSVIVHRLRFSDLPDLYTNVMEVLGTFLSLPLTNMNSLSETTLQALYSSSRHLLKASRTVSLHSLTHTRQEKLFEILSNPWPIPYNEQYYGYVDSGTMKSLNLPLLSAFSGIIEGVLERDCSELWQRVLKAKQKTLIQVVRHTEMLKDVLEEEYLAAHATLVKDKRLLDECIENRKTQAKSLHHCTDFDAVMATDPLPVVEKVCAAAYLITAPTFNDSPSWDTILSTVFQPSCAAFSFALLNANTIVYSRDRCALLFDLVDTITLTSVMKAASPALDVLYQWTLAATAYLRQVGEMLPIQNNIRGFSETMDNWERHNERSITALKELNGVLPEETQEDLVEMKEEVVGIEEVRRKVVETIEGWHEYNTAAEILSEKMIEKLFSDLDVDHDGVLSRSEIMLMDGCLERFGVPLDKRLNEFVDAHATPAGELTLDAFGMFMLRIAAR